MMGFDGFGGGMGFGGIGMIVFWLFIFAGVIMLVRMLGGFGAAGARRTAPQDAERAPLAILRERYAKGEIDLSELDRKRRELEVR